MAHLVRRALLFAILADTSFRMLRVCRVSRSDLSDLISMLDICSLTLLGTIFVPLVGAFVVVAMVA